MLDFLILLKRKEQLKLFFIEGYNLFSKPLGDDNNNLIIKLNSKIEQLDEVVVRANKKIFQIKRMQDYEGTSVFAGKKTK